MKRPVTKRGGMRMKTCQKWAVVDDGTFLTACERRAEARDFIKQGKDIGADTSTERIARVEVREIPATRAARRKKARRK